jgi:hypothetical protein
VLLAVLLLMVVILVLTIAVVRGVLLSPSY